MRVVSLCTFLLLTAVSTAAWATPSRVGFTIAFQEVETDLSIITTSVMPADRLLIRTVAQAWSEQGSLQQSAGGWEWLAPEEPGHYAIHFNHASEQLTLQVFVLTPFQNGQQDALDGFRIGSYQQELFRGLATYAASDLPAVVEVPTIGNAMGTHFGRFFGTLRDSWAEIGCSCPNVPLPRRAGPTVGWRVIR